MIPPPDCQQGLCRTQGLRYNAAAFFAPDHPAASRQIFRFDTEELLAMEKDSRGLGLLSGDRVTLAAAILLAVLLFGFRYGFRILDPGNADWLLGRQDPATSYLAWLFFLSEPWSFPLGQVSGYLAPAGTTVGLTDSIPLLALPLKALGFLLPADFQYFGLWKLLNHCLQAVFGYLLVAQLTSRRRLRLTGAVLLLLSPVFLLRENHLALAGHWVILAGLWLYVRSNAELPYRRNLVSWLVLMVVCCCIHPYLAVMVLAIAVAAWLRDFLGWRRLGFLRFVAALAALPAVMLLTWFLIGYQLTGNIAAGSGTLYGSTAMNLNAPWNPLETSLVLPELPTIYSNKYEGYNYLGLGWLLLGVIALWVLIRDPGRLKVVRPHLPLGLILGGLAVFALGEEIALGERVLLSYSLPGWLQPLANPFRAAGRFFWAPLYTLPVVAMALATRPSRPRGPRRLPVLLALCLAMQVIDLSPILNLRSVYGSLRFTSRLQSPQWEEILAGTDFIATYPPFLMTTDYELDFKDLGLLAWRHGKQTSAGYTARRLPADVEATVEAMRAEMFGPDPDPRRIYILRTSYFAEHFHDMQDHFQATDIDGYKVCLPRRAAYRPDRIYRVERHELADYLLARRQQTVIVAVKDDGATRLDARTRQVMRDLGSRIDQLRPGGSYVALLHGGALLFEQVQNHSQIEADADAGTAVGPLVLRKSISLLSGGKGYGDVASILVNGRERSFNSRGLNLVVLDENQEVSEIAVFNPALASRGNAFRLVRRDE